MSTELMTPERLSDIAERWATSRRVSNYQMHISAGVSPATVGRFFSKKGAVTLSTALRLLNVIGLDVQIVEIEPESTPQESENATD